MSKVAAYLQEHILGEVSTHPTLLKAMSTDASVLEIMPEMVAYPRVTNDIRKIARFAWQLAEKGHVLPLTARGGGSDQTGAAIGKGIVIVTPAHMNRIFEFDAKQKFLRLQPGANAQAVNDALSLHGMSIPSLPVSSSYSTIGGAVANNATGVLSGRYGDTSEWVHQLEVVLANGDVLQTERLNRRDLNKIKGKQSFEGEIYRSLDNLIEDNKEMIDEKLGGEARDNVGYAAITKVKRKDGSFDLTPLIVGSQGTLGLISELIMKAEFTNTKQVVAAAAFTNKEVAHDMLDQLRVLNPTSLEHFDGELFTVAADLGKTYEVCKTLDGLVGAVILVSFDDFSDHTRAKKLKKVRKLLESVEAQAVYAEDDDARELLAIREVTAYGLLPMGKDVSAPPLFDGAYVPDVRFADFQTAVAELAKKHQISLPLHSRVLDDVYYARPLLQLKKVGDKQKVFKLLDEYADLIEHHGGHLIAEAGEGRMKARFAYKTLDDDVLELFAAIKAIFDPYGILNPDVKQQVELRQLVTELSSDYTTAALGQHSLYN
jgi:FAD/FMN-containing dehydrogenase